MLELLLHLTGQFLAYHVLLTVRWGQIHSNTSNTYNHMPSTHSLMFRSLVTIDYDLSLLSHGLEITSRQVLMSEP